SRTNADFQQTVINWCTEQERGLIHQAHGIGRLRAAKPEDLDFTPSLNDYSLIALDENYRDYAPTIEDAGKDRTRLVLKAPNNELRALIDTARHVLLEIEHRQYGKMVDTTKFDDFVEVGGVCWARKVESINHLGQRVGLTTYTVRELGADDFAARVKQEL